MCVCEKVTIKSVTTWCDQDVVTCFRGPSRYFARAWAFSRSIPNPTDSLAYKHNKMLATCVIATLPSCKHKKRHLVNINTKTA